MAAFTFKPDHWLIPDWPAPANIHGATSLRHGGVSLPPYDSLNLGKHVGDDPAAVTENRRRLQLPSEPIWLTQTHGTHIIDAARHKADQAEADGSTTTQAGVICAVLTADCLPVLICNSQGTQVAAIHAGWRGLAAGILEAAIKKFSVNNKELLIWLGPAIGPAAYEVGDEVRDIFLSHDASAKSAFLARQGKWQMNIYPLARQRLQALGITAIYGGQYCSYTKADRFFSYRRDGISGRMASLIWM
ncbi:FIG00003370: Multicopper polyphenol oxidase [hydrothermal vent metagenome]|uniref:FIG00003370: Multicopper polyphenol oxidase n=1 Tax=hydrothermal vent metagenome TaxID=652676 RepID=A0A3B1BSN9_9ZZZZ